jgi:hypothetical protein
MFKHCLTALTFFVSVNALAEYSLDDVKKLRNDKEVHISSFSNKEALRLQAKYTDEVQLKRNANIFYNVMLEFVNREDKHCELKFMDNLQAKLAEEKIASNKEDIEEYLKVLRVKHSIDDILYEILSSVNKDYFALKSLDLNKKAKRLFFGHNKIAAANDLKEIYSGFSEFPDEESRCFYQEYMFVSNHLKKSDGAKSNKLGDFKTLTIKAFEQNLFPLATFNKIRYLQDESSVNKRNIWLNDYLKVIFNAKNKMVPLKYSYKPRKIEEEDEFSSKRIKRFSKITRRKLLYAKYDETQIVLLSQVLQKASRRMGVDVDTDTKRPFISQEFSVLNANGERTNYVETLELDPQSQYNLARRLLRKDMTELQMMDLFVMEKITHEDIVMAALETGYISLEEIEFVVQYDDLWNPEITKFEKISGFIFQVAGYATFFLPPPWNITASIALGVVEGVVDAKHKKGSENDNPATFIE